MKLFILITCTCIYTATAEKVDFIQQPTTDKQCYYEGDNGTLTLSYHVTGTTPLDFYKVALTTNPDGTGGFKSNGTKLNFYDTSDRDTKHARFRVTMSSISRTAEYWLHVSSLELHDETVPLYASIIESHSGIVMIKSSVGAKFRVEKTCPQRPQPDEPPTTITSTPSNDNTPTINILTQWHAILGAAIALLISILIICLAILAISIVILYWLSGTPINPSLKRQQDPVAFWRGDGTLHKHQM